MTDIPPLPVHVPYRPVKQRVLLTIPPWFCLTCWRPREVNIKPVREPWPCRWTRMELQDRGLLGDVQRLLNWAAREAAEDLGMPESDLRWRMLSWLIVPQDTEKLRIVHPRGPGAAETGRSAAPVRTRGPSR